MSSPQTLSPASGCTSQEDPSSGNSSTKGQSESQSSSSTILSIDQKTRMEKNREAARQRLKQKAETLLEKNSSSQAANGFGGFVPEEIQPPKAKKARSAKETEFMMDLKNVCSEGSIVRVQGTKLIDTGGGFLIEEKDLVEQEEAEKIITVKPAGLVPTDCPNCEECQALFTDSFLLQTFDYPVCDNCKDTEEKHSLITRTDAKNEFLLKDVDFDRREPMLKFISRPNPHNTFWGDMKLYLRPQVEKRALEVWGSLENIEEQLELREENRAKSKIKKYSKKMKSLRMSARSSLFTRDLAPHEHSWGPEECVDEDEDMYKHTCTDCGQVESFEKM